jgi:hypothetical protein
VHRGDDPIARASLRSGNTSDGLSRSGGGQRIATSRGRTPARFFDSQAVQPIGLCMLSPHDDPTMPRYLGQQEDVPETRQGTPLGVHRGTLTPLSRYRALLLDRTYRP